MNCSIGCVKCLVFVFNIVYAIVGVSLLSMGTIFFTQELDTKLDADASAVATETNDAIKALTNGALLFLISGVLALLLAALGCFGAIKESPLILRVFGSILVVLAIIHVVISGMSFAASKDEDSLMESRKKVADNLLKYTDDFKYRHVQHDLETKYHCCGGNSYEDYRNITPPVKIPQSCCLEGTEPCNTMGETLLKDKGCAEAVAEKIVFLYKTVGAVCAILLILEIIGAIGAYFLAVTILNHKRRGTFT